MQPGPAILILAAGASSRMRGADKLLMQVGSEPLLARIAARACATGQPVLVALPAGDSARRAALTGLPVSLLDVTNPASGMSAGISSGLWPSLA